MNFIELGTLYLIAILLVVFIAAVIEGQRSEPPSRRYARVYVRSRENDSRRLPPEEDTGTLEIKHLALGALLLAGLIALVMSLN